MKKNGILLPPSYKCAFYCTLHSLYLDIQKYILYYRVSVLITIIFFILRGFFWYKGLFCNVEVFVDLLKSIFLLEREGGRATFEINTRNSGKNSYRTGISLASYCNKEYWYKEV